MDPNKESIICEKNGQTKRFSQNQLDLLGRSEDGSYDGWVPKVEKPSGIPDLGLRDTQIPVPDAGKGKAVTENTAIDPNGGLTLQHEASVFAQTSNPPAEEGNQTEIKGDDEMPNAETVIVETDGTVVNPEGKTDDAATKTESVNTDSTPPAEDTKTERVQTGRNARNRQ